MIKNNFRMQGFTLFEMIAVIAILSIMVALSGKFVMQSTNAYESTQTRSHLINTGRQAVESMSRQLRVSLSYSVRIVTDSTTYTCLEFLPIVSGGNYIDPVADSSNGVATSTTINVSPHTVDYGSAQYVSIGAASSGELYGATPVSLATLSSRTSTILTLSTSKRWQRNSLTQHFFLLDTPQAFCVVSGQLRFYSGQDITSSTVSIGSTYSILANSVTATTPFSISAGSENRNTNVLFNLTFVDGSESITLNQSVMIRNVP